MRDNCSLSSSVSHSSLFPSFPFLVPHLLPSSFLPHSPPIFSWLVEDPVPPQPVCSMPLGPGSSKIPPPPGDRPVGGCSGSSLAEAHVLCNQRGACAMEPSLKRATQPVCTQKKGEGCVVSEGPYWCISSLVCFINSQGIVNTLVTPNGFLLKFQGASVLCLFHEPCLVFLSPGFSENPCVAGGSFRVGSAVAPEFLRQSLFA